jgi:dTMP kinase
VISLDFSYETCRRIINVLGKIFPLPVKTFWVNLPAEIAFKRKNDIPSIEYLIERQQIYSSICKDYGFIEVDGCNSIESNCKRICEFIER